MGLQIGTNSAALTTSRIIENSTADAAKSYQRLASGQRITQAGDDAAGLSISENLKAQVRSLGQAERNANDGISFTQVAEGGLTEVSNIMIRLRELGIQAASDTIGDRERGFIHEEVTSLVEEIDRIANVTNFNGTPLLNAQSKKGVLEFQVGIQGTTDDRIVFDTAGINVRTGFLGIDTLNFQSVDSAREGLDKIDQAMSKVFSNRASLGAIQSKLQSSMRSLAITKENLEIARSHIADTDIAKESSELMRTNILQSAGVAVLAQANTAPAQALKLL